MDVEKIFRMTGGSGKTSYSRNSSLQKRASDKVKHITLETLEQVYRTLTPKSLGMADFGCSSGPNTLSNVEDMVDTIEATCHNILQSPTPEFRVYLNDLPTNDFNAVFQSLPEFYNKLKKGRCDGGPSVYIAGYPGSFYGRLFPDYCLHFIYSSHSLHWLSRVPPGLYDENNRSINKGSIYISKLSPPQVPKAYHEQFFRDFSLFLRSRSEELVGEGRMVLILLGREAHDHVDRGNSFLWELLTRSLATLVSKGDIEKEKIDSYDVHFYVPSREELEEVVSKEGLFKLDHLEMFEAEKEINGQYGTSYGVMVAMAVRAIQESMLAHHFGESILDSLFELYARLVDEEMAKQIIKPIMFVAVLRKL